MSHRSSPAPAYWAYLYSAVAITAICAAVLLVHGDTTAGVLLLAATASEGVMVVLYRRRTQRG